MHVLVTGAAGYVGGAVVDRLAAAGHQVTALVRRPTAVPWPAGVEVVVADLRDPASLTAAKLDRGFDGVCHLAALARVRDSRVDPIRYFGVNVEGTRQLLAALVRGASAAGRPPAVVLASTCSIYGEVARQPIQETAPTLPTTPYGATKLAAEQLLAAVAGTGAIGSVALRSFNVAGAVDRHGDGDLTRLVPKAVAAAAGAVPALQVNGDGSAAREYLHVADAADAYAAALGLAEPGSHLVYNVGSGTGTTITEVIVAVERASGRAVPRETRPPADEPQVLVADSARFRAVSGWASQRSGIDRIAADAWRWQLDREPTPTR